MTMYLVLSAFTSSLILLTSNYHSFCDSCNTYRQYILDMKYMLHFSLQIALTHLTTTTVRSRVLQELATFLPEC